MCSLLVFYGVECLSDVHCYSSFYGRNYMYVYPYLIIRLFVLCMVGIMVLFVQLVPKTRLT